MIGSITFSCSCPASAAIITVVSLPITLKRGEEKLNRLQNPVAPYPYKTEEVTFNNVTDKATLVGTLPGTINTTGVCPFL